MNEERLKVGVPEGVQPGQTIRLRGKGGAGQHGAPAGDLLLELKIEPHNLYTLDGIHLVLQVPLTVLEALKGAKVKVPTPDGAIRVNIPAGAAPGTTMRIKGRGLPRGQGQRGDLRLVLQPVVPSSDDTEAIHHAEALESFYTVPVRDWD